MNITVVYPKPFVSGRESISIPLKKFKNKLDAFSEKLDMKNMIASLVSLVREENVDVDSSMYSEWFDHLLNECVSDKSPRVTAPVSLSEVLNMKVSARQPSMDVLQVTRDTIDYKASRMSAELDVTYLKMEGAK